MSSYRNDENFKVPTEWDKEQDACCGQIPVGTEVVLQQVPFSIARFCGELLPASFVFGLALIVLAGAAKASWILLHL